MEQSGVFYVRFMDDLVVLAPSRWKLRRAVKAVHEVLDRLRLEKHPDKTMIGRIERGFDFLGYHFSRSGLAVAKATLATFVERATRLYERDRKEPSSPSRLGRYVRRWVGWAGRNVSFVMVAIPCGR
jgi:RNA-directed DNA polymerase